VFHDDVTHWWNGERLAKVLLELFNWHVTALDKSNNISKFSKWDEISYLKRHFRMENGIVYPALEKKTLRGMVQWVKENHVNSNDDQTILNCRVALVEWFFWGEQEFNHHKNILNEFIQAKDPKKVFDSTWAELNSNYLKGLSSA